MTLSTKAKESIKTALAMVIAYGIALAMNWDKPMWAGIAVAFTSLATIGQSVNKAALRMAGTVIAAVVALIFISLFAQDRWLSMAVLSMWVGFCTYMMGGAKHQYFWQVCGFVCAIIVIEAGPDSVNAFTLAVLRTEETGLGILVYSIVAILLCPSTSRVGFAAAAKDLAAVQHQLYGSYMGLMRGRVDAEPAQPLMDQAIQRQARFAQLLDAAETENYQVREQRELWRRFQRQATELTNAVERWHESIPDLQSLDLHRLLPGLADLDDELDRRLTQIERMLDGQAPEHYPSAAKFDLDQTRARELSHFHKAALAVAADRLRQIETMTGSLFENVRALKGFADDEPVSLEARPSMQGFVPDPERLAAAVQAMSTLWFAYLLYIFVDGLPGGHAIVIFAAPLGMIMASMPQLSVTVLVKPVLVSSILASVLYIFVMPQLSRFADLGLLLFLFTFTICYLYADPRQLLGRAFGLVLFLAIAGISNTQSYNFLVIPSTVLPFLMIFLLLALTAHIPFSPRPESVIVRLLGRFFRSYEFLISIPGSDRSHPLNRMDAFRHAFHTREIATLPAKIGSWTPHLESDVLADTTPEQVQALVSTLQALTYRMQESLAERSGYQAPVLADELRSDVLAWRDGVKKLLLRLSRVDLLPENEELGTRLARSMELLQDRIEASLDGMSESQLSDREAEQFYRLLGSYRGLSEALIDYAGCAGAIDWDRWREEKFA
jgi:uncharacterized membrane protein YccC